MPHSDASSPVSQPSLHSEPGESIPSRMDYPLSALQKGLLATSLLAPDSGYYIQQLVCHWNEPLNSKHWIKTWHFLAMRHEVLRTSFLLQNTHETLQTFHPICLPDIHFQSIPPDVAQSPEAYLQDYLKNDRRTGFDLEHPPLWRLRILTWNEFQHVIIWTFHHALLDGRSHFRVWKEALDHYDALDQALPSPTLPPSPPFHSYLEWLETSPKQTAMAYWQKALSQFQRSQPVPANIADQAHSKSDNRSLEISFQFSPSETQALHTTAKHFNVTLNNLTQAAWALVLGKLTQTHDVCFGTVRAGRHWTNETPDIRVGLYINTVPFRVQIPLETPLNTWLQSIHQQQVQIRQGEHASSEEIRTWLALPPQTPLYHALLVFENRNTLADLSSPKRSLQLFEKTNTLTLAGYLGETLKLTLEYPAGQFTPDWMEAVLQQVRSLLLQFTQAPINQPLHRLSFDSLPSSQTSSSSQAPCSTSNLNHQKNLEWQARWNQTDRDYPHHRTVLDFFKQQVTNQPDSIALKFTSGSLTYSELDERSNRIARALLAHSLEPEEIVPIRFERSVGYVLSVLAILKAGGSYLPLESNTPTARQELLLSISQARIAITDLKGLASFLGWTGTLFSVDDDASEFTSFSPDPISTTPNPSHRAYVIFTSGSTGTPKGVEIEHRHLTNLICFYIDYLELSPADRAPLTANPVFDASVADLWPTLCAGGTIFIPETQLMSQLDDFIQWIHQEQITLCFMSTALGELMIQRPWPETMALKYFLVGGEELHLYPPKPLPFEVINCYGPTENTVDSIWSIVRPDPTRRKPAIGHPIGNVKAYILDSSLNPVGIDEIGELYLGGKQVARGYLHRPDLTQERFLPDPFCSRGDPGRMYRTGDLARRRSDGEIEYLGRIDDQIQIHGQRIELGEIEAALLRHPKIHLAACRPLIDEGKATGIIAHYVYSDEADPDPTLTLKNFLRTQLPEAMIPKTFLRHTAIKLTPQGKVDRQALPSKIQKSESPSSKPEHPPGDALEAAVQRIWQQFIAPFSSHSVIQPDSTFFEAGGDSLLAVKLLLEIESLTGKKFPLSSFLLNPTLQGLQSHLANEVHQAYEPVLTLNRKGSAPPLFFIYELYGDVNVYFNLADSFSKDHPLFAIRSLSLHQNESLPQSMEQAARQVREWIRRIHPEGPFGLVGYSWGGLLAFEIAHQTLSEERYSPYCALIGTLAPPRILSFSQRLSHTIQHFPQWLRHFLGDHGHRWMRMKRGTRFLSRLGRNIVQGENLEVPSWVKTPLAQAHVRLSFEYQPRIHQPVPIHLFRERKNFNPETHPAAFVWTDYEEDGGWKRWAKCAPQIHWLDTDHIQVMKQPFAENLALQIQETFEQELKNHSR